MLEGEKQKKTHLLQMAFVGFTCCPERNCRNFLISTCTSTMCAGFLS